MNCTVNAGTTPYFVLAMCINSLSICSLFSSVHPAHNNSKKPLAMSWLPTAKDFLIWILAPHKPPLIILLPINHRITRIMALVRLLWNRLHRTSPNVVSSYKYWGFAAFHFILFYSLLLAARWADLLMFYAQIAGILFIIQIVESIWYFLLLCCCIRFTNAFLYCLFFIYVNKTYFL